MHIRNNAFWFKNNLFDALLDGTGEGLQKVESIEKEKKA